VIRDQLAQFGGPGGAATVTTVPGASRRSVPGHDQAAIPAPTTESGSATS
jgi:hypothetical protein